MPLSVQPKNVTGSSIWTLYPLRLKKHIHRIKDGAGASMNLLSSLHSAHDSWQSVQCRISIGESGLKAGRLHPLDLLVTAVTTFQRTIRPTFWLYAAQSMLQFLIERCSARLTNAGFLMTVGSEYTVEQVGPLWWLSVNPDLTNFMSGYNYSAYVVAAISYPLIVAVSAVTLLALFRIASEALDCSPDVVYNVKAAPLPTSQPTGYPPQDSKLAAAVDSTIHTSSVSSLKPEDADGTVLQPKNAAPLAENVSDADERSKAGDHGMSSDMIANMPRKHVRGMTSPRPAVWGVKKAAATVVAVLHEDIRRVFTTSLLVSAFEALLLAASSLFVTLPFTIPCLVILQLAIPISVLEGPRHLDAIRVSKERMHGCMWCAALVLGLVYLAQAMVPPVSTVLISSLPQKVGMAVPEIVIALLIFTQTAIFAASQLKGLTALILYRAISRSQSMEAAQESAL